MRAWAYPTRGRVSNLAPRTGGGPIRRLCASWGGMEDGSLTVVSGLSLGTSVELVERPTRIGPYRILDVLGKGGMGVVYRAFDTKLNRSVAVKFLSAEVADAEARRRFQREAQMASSLNHPHIVTVHDAGEWEGEQYVVTEFLDGGTLSSWAAAQARS